MPSTHPTPSYSTVRVSGLWSVIRAPFETESMPDGEPLTVPECSHLQPILYPDRPFWGDHLRPINDSAWFYQRTFEAPDQAFRRARLRFEGVDYFATVWLNGQYVGQHEGNFTPFTLDVTDAIQPGENTLVVRVSSPWDAPNPRGSYPTDHVIRGLVKGLYEHGEGVIPPNVNPIGIWRPVWLLLDDGVSLDHVQIRTKIDGTVDLRISATNTTEQTWTGTLDLQVEAENHDGKGLSSSIPVEIAPGKQVIEQTLHIAEPNLWWPWDQGEPNLYRLTLTLKDETSITSELDDVFGVREVHLDRSPERFTYRINGRPVFLRGSSYLPGLYLSQCDREWLARDLTLAREANLNLLRVHVHVSPPELYDLCDRQGILIWQDFELNWIHDPSEAFEARALVLQRDMMTMLENHPAIITWTCYNEPTMVFTRRQNLEQHPAPALYADALSLDPTRPIFLCSGQMESDWQRAGDAHTYYGALWTADYTDVYKHRFLVNTEFGFEAPAAQSTLETYPDVWERLNHLAGKIDDLWGYQSELVQYHVEHMRRLRTTGCAGYVHFWLVDLVPQVGCGVVDALRHPKGGYAALKQASQPLLPSLEHDGRRVHAIWVFNDTQMAYPGASIRWRVSDATGNGLIDEQATVDIAANASQKIRAVDWTLSPAQCTRVELTITDSDGHLLAENHYDHPLQPTPRPRGYPWKFDRYLGTKVFDRPGAPSLADQSGNPLMKIVPLRVREEAAEWALRQKLPTWLVSRLSRIVDRFNQ